jgi:SAM-dependent methyltransferase
MAFQSWWEHNVILSFQDQLSMPIALSSCAFQVQPEHPCRYIGRADCMRSDPHKHLFVPALPLLPALPGSANQAISDPAHHLSVLEKSSVFHYDYRNWRVAEYKNYDYDKRKSDMNSITDEQVKEFYHKNHIVVDEGISNRHQAMFSFFQDINFNRMLDIGCGCGHLVNWIMENKKSDTVEGVDISCDHIDAAKKLYPAINVRCESVFDIEVSTYDMISMTDVLEHIRDDDHDKLLDLLDKLSDVGTYLYINHPLASAVYEQHSQIIDIPIKLSGIVEMFSERNYILQFSQRWDASYMNLLFMKDNSNN